MTNVEIKILRALRLELRHGDVTRIADETGRSRSHISRCLNPDIDLFNQDVVAAAKEYIEKRKLKSKQLLTALSD